MLNEKQKAIRALGLGGSEIAAVCGLSPWKSAIDVYMDKLGLTEEGEQTRAALWGEKLEPVLAQHYADTHGVTVTEIIDPDHGGQRVFVHPEYPVARCMPDRIVEHGEHAHSVLEIKTCTLRLVQMWGIDPESDEVPDQYLVQVMWNMGTLLALEEINMNEGHLITLIGGQDDREFTIRWDAELFEMLLGRANKFWDDHVAAQQPPPMDASDGSKALLKQLFPEHKGDIVSCSAETEELVFKLKDVRAEAERIEEEKATLENQIKQEIGDNAGIQGDFGKITWKKAKDSKRTNWKDVALELDAPQDIIDENTKVTPGSRRFIVPRGW